MVNTQGTPADKICHVPTASPESSYSFPSPAGTCSLSHHCFSLERPSLPSNCLPSGWSFTDEPSDLLKVQIRLKYSPAYNPPKTSCGFRIKLKFGAVVCEASNSPASTFFSLHPIRFLPTLAILLFPEYIKLFLTSGPLPHHLLCLDTLPPAHFILRSSGLSSILFTYIQRRSQGFQPCKSQLLNF